MASTPATRAGVRLALPEGAARAPGACPSKCSRPTSTKPRGGRSAGGNRAAPLAAQGQGSRSTLRRRAHHRLATRSQRAAAGSYGKPGNHENAARQLRELSGKTVDFHTAVTVLDAVSGQARVAAGALPRDVPHARRARASRRIWSGETLRLRGRRQGRRPRHRAHRAHRDRGSERAHRPAADRAHRDAGARRAARAYGLADRRSSMRSRRRSAARAARSAARFGARDDPLARAISWSRTRRVARAFLARARHASVRRRTDSDRWKSATGPDAARPAARPSRSWACSRRQAARRSPIPARR